MKVKYILYTFIIFIFFIAAKPARAFEISPVKSLFTIDPGISQTMVVKISATSPSSGVSVSPMGGKMFKLSVLGMMQDENGKPVFSRGVDLAESWVYPENNLVNIKSGETKSVNFIIKIPVDAIAGSYYLGLAVEPVEEKNNNTNPPLPRPSGELAIRLVSLLTLEVKGIVRESVVIEKCDPYASLAG